MHKSLNQVNHKWGKKEHDPFFNKFGYLKQYTIYLFFAGKTKEYFPLRNPNQIDAKRSLEIVCVTNKQI